MRKQAKRKPVKGFVSIHVRQITGLDKYNGSSVYIDWYRGSRSKHSGHTKFSLVRENTAIFDECIEFSTTFFPDASGAYHEKLFALALIEASSSKKSAVLLKNKVNLMTYLPKDLKGTCYVSIPIGAGALMEAAVNSQLFEGDFSYDDLSITVDSVSTTAQDPDSGGGDDDGPAVPGVPVSESQALIDSLRKEIRLLKSDNQAQKQVLTELEISYEKLKDEVSSLQSSASASIQTSASPTGLTTSSSSTAKGNTEAHVLRSQKKIATHKKRMTVAPGSLATPPTTLAAMPSSAVHKTRHNSVGKRAGRFSVGGGGGGGVGRTGQGESLAALLSTGAGAGADGAADAVEREFTFVSSEIFGCSMKVVAGVPVTAQILMDRLQETNALGASAEAKERLMQMREALEGAVAACVGNVKRMAYWLAVCAHAMRLANGIMGDDKIIKEERAAQHEAAMKMFGELAAIAYANVVTFLIEKIRPNFVHTIFDTLQNDEMVASFPGSAQNVKNNNSNNSNINSNNGQNIAKKSAPSINLMEELFAIPFSGMVASMTESGVPQKVLLQVVDHLCRSLCVAAFNHIIGGGKALCSVQMGFQIKLQLSKIRDILYGLGLREAYNAFSPLEEVAILMITDTSMFVDVKILQDMCPSLSLAQARAVLALLPKAPQTFLFRTRNMVSKEDTERMADPVIAASITVD